MNTLALATIIYIIIYFLRWTSTMLHLRLRFGYTFRWCHIRPANRSSANNTAWFMYSEIGNIECTKTIGWNVLCPRRHKKCWCLRGEYEWLSFSLKLQIIQIWITCTFFSRAIVGERCYAWWTTPWLLLVLCLTVWLVGHQACLGFILKLLITSISLHKPWEFTESESEFSSQFCHIKYIIHLFSNCFLITNIIYIHNLCIYNSMQSMVSIYHNIIIIIYKSKNKNKLLWVILWNFKNGKHDFSLSPACTILCYFYVYINIFLTLGASFSSWINCLLSIHVKHVCL